MPVDKVVGLLVTDNRGVGVAAYLNSDHLFVTEPNEGVDDEVVFHRSGAGYTIQIVGPHWSGYDDWHVGHDGIRCGRNCRACSS